MYMLPHLQQNLGVRLEMIWILSGLSTLINDLLAK